jgi:hypothetical protein
MSHRRTGLRIILILAWLLAGVQASAARLFIITVRGDFPAPPDRLLQPWAPDAPPLADACGVSVVLDSPQAVEQACLELLGEAPRLQTVHLHLDLPDPSFWTAFILKSLFLNLKAVHPGLTLLVTGTTGPLLQDHMDWYADAMEGSPVISRSARVAVPSLAEWTTASDSAGVLLTRDPDPEQTSLFEKTIESGLSTDRMLQPVPSEVLALIREEDLATVLLVPPGPFRSIFVPSTWYGSAIGPSGKSMELRVEKDGVRLSAGASEHWERITLLRPAQGEGYFTEKTGVMGKKQFSLDEILAHVQLDFARARRVLPYYAVDSATVLRLKVGAIGQSVQLKFKGRMLFAGGLEKYWSWEVVEVEGKPWKGRSLPPIPMLQPEQVRIQPFDLLPQEEYEYRLRGEEEMRGVPSVRVDFAPTAAFLKQGLPAYEGSFWVRQDDLGIHFERRRQLNLTKEILEYEEETVFAPSLGVLLPASVRTRENHSILGSWTLVETDITYSNFREIPQVGETVRDWAAGSRRMMERTDRGWVPMAAEKERTRFLALGLNRDPDSDYPLPLGGLAWFSLKPDKQYSFVFAGVLGFATRSFFLGRKSLTFDGFFLAIHSDDSVYREGKKVEAETLGVLPASGSLKLLMPVSKTFSLSVGVEESYLHFKRADATAEDFRIPDSGLTTTGSLALNWTWRGFTAIASGDTYYRHSFHEWGYPSDPQTLRQGSHWGFSFGKEFYFSELSRLNLDAGYLGGHDLDRFTQYRTGGYGNATVRGFASGAASVDRAIVGHAAQTIIIPQFFNLTVGLDVGRFEGRESTTLAGMGLSTTFFGPWDTMAQAEAGIGLKGEGKSWSLRLLIFKSLD